MVAKVTRYILVLWIGCSYASNGQPQEDGFYLTVKCTKAQQRYTSLLNQKKVCLTDRPVVTLKDFESVSQVHEWRNQGYIFFDVVLTVSGYNALRNLTELITDAEVALVLGGNIIFVLAPEERGVHRSFRILMIVSRQKQNVDEKPFFEAHEKLKEMIEERKQKSLE